MSKTNINLSKKYDRVIVLVDMDCFYCQVEQKLDPSLKGKPIAVVQYNAWKGGGIIAVNYEARDKGVTRHMRGDEAKGHCPEIELVRVPNVREKADLSKYRNAGKEVASVLQSFANTIERASVDEAYLDITERVMERLHQMNEGKFSLSPDKLDRTFAVGFENVTEFVKQISQPDNVNRDSLGELDPEMIKVSNIKMLVAATIVNEIRAAVKEKTGYECSAGIAHNKIMSKLVCGLNKPNKQTVLPITEIGEMFKTLPVGKVKGLGGKFGEIVCESLKIKYMGDLVQYTERELQNKFDEKNGTWLYLLARGIDLEPVNPRFASKSIGCCKKFPGKNAITGLNTLKHWLNELADEIMNRLEKDLTENSRRAKLLTVSYMQTIDKEDISSSRSVSLDIYDKEKLISDSLECIKRNTEQFLSGENSGVLNNAIKFLGLSVSKFEKEVVNKNTIQEMFQKQKSLPKPKSKKPIQEDQNIKMTSKPILQKKSFFQMHFTNKPTVESSETNTKIEPDSNLDSQTESPEIVDPIPSTSGLQIRSISEINSSVLEEKEIPENKVEDNCKESVGSNEFLASELKQPEEKSPSKYTSLYAEFHNQNLNLEDFMQVCEQCNKKIIAYEYQSHLDYHYAKSLSEKQREEFRNSIKVKLAASPASSPRVKKKAISNKNKVKTSISNFFKKEENEATFEGPVELCAECQKSIPLARFVEHSDMHAAKKLQMELNRSQVVPVVTKTVPNQPSCLPRKNAKSSPNISLYFTQNGDSLS